MSDGQSQADGRIKAVLFDLGGTLIEYAGRYSRWPELEIPGLTAAYERLAQLGAILPDRTRFVELGLASLPARWQAATRGERNLVLAEYLAELLIGCDGAGPHEPAMIADAAGQYEAAVCRDAVPVTGAKAVLAELKRAGHKLGLLSNTMFSGQAHLADLERFGMAGYLDAALFSSDAAHWKPSPEPFRRLLVMLAVPAGAAVFVGDDPASDVVGSQGAGLRAVYFRSSDRFHLPEGVRPDAEITALDQLPGLVAQWSGLL
jgi:putative hydrolase of the HAD superfamily